MTVFSVHSGTDDVETIMGAVGEALRLWEGGATEPLDLALTQAQSDRLAQRARQLTLQWNIDGDAIIHSTRRGSGPWLISLQAAVRRLTWWFLEPILQQIRLFQMNTAQVLDGVVQNQEALMSHLTDLPQEEWKSRLEALEAHVSELRRRISEGEDDAL